MRFWTMYAVGLAGILWAEPAAAQASAQQEVARRFEASGLRPGSPFPVAAIHDAQGKPFDTGSLRGGYTVVIGGCLTCPPFLRKVPALETVFRDYAPKGVRFYYLYRSVAHPGLNGYVAPLTLDERLQHVAEAKRTLGTAIPWLADTMDNELFAAIGEAPNSEFVLDSNGAIVRMRVWSEPDELRADLAELVGPVERPTRVSDLDLPAAPPPKLAPTGVVPLLQREGRWGALVLEPLLDGSEHPFYVKLRAEAEPGLLDSGEGKLYLGFFVDPIHAVYWNNQVAPVRYEIEAGGAVTVSPSAGQGPRVEAESDADPREFLLDVRLDEARAPARVRFRYYACSEKWCMPVTQEYTLHWRPDPTIGWSMTGRTLDPRSEAPAAGARPGGAPAIEQMLRRADRDGDGFISRDEAPPALRERFGQLDRNGDGKLSREEMEAGRGAAGAPRPGR